VNSEIHLEALIVRTCRLQSRQSGDTLEGCDRARLEIHLEAMIERDWTSTWRRLIDSAPELNSSVSNLATVGM